MGSHPTVANNEGQGSPIWHEGVADWRGCVCMIHYLRLLNTGRLSTGNPSPSHELASNPSTSSLSSSSQKSTSWEFGSTFSKDFVLRLLLEGVRIHCSKHRSTDQRRGLQEFVSHHPKRPLAPNRQFSRSVVEEQESAS